MPVEYARMVEFLRDVHSRPGGTGAVLNLIHGSKLRWSSDLSALTETFRAVDDAYCGALAEYFDRAAQAA